MKSFKMKALAVAVLGLAGIGSAMAACPTAPTTSATPGGGGAWTSQTVTSGSISITAPGLDSTGCKLSVALAASPPSNAKVFVTDSSPQNEARYRARFYVDLSQLSSSFTVSNQQIRLFNANATTGPGTTSTAEVTVVLLGGTTPSFRFQVADSGISPSFFKTITVAAPTPTGVNRIEFDYNTAPGSTCAATNTHGSFCYWVTDGATSSTDAAPTGSYLLTANSFDTTGTTGWSGVKLSNLGAFSSSTNYRTASGVATQVISLDEFDSRRQTFIGQ